MRLFLLAIDYFSFVSRLTKNNSQASLTIEDISVLWWFASCLSCCFNVSLHLTTICSVCFIIGAPGSLSSFLYLWHRAITFWAWITPGQNLPLGKNYLVKCPYRSSDFMMSFTFLRMCRSLPAILFNSDSTDQRSNLRPLWRIVASRTPAMKNS